MVFRLLLRDHKTVLEKSCMKKTLLVALVIVGFGTAAAKADVAFSVSFGNHYSPRPCAPVYAAPVVVAAPVYRHYSPPIVVQPYCAPVAPVCAPVYATPVYTVSPQPVYHVAPVYRSYHSYGYEYSDGSGHGSDYSRPSYGGGQGCGPRPGGMSVGW